MEKYIRKETVSIGIRTNWREMRLTYNEIENFYCNFIQHVKNKYVELNDIDYFIKSFANDIFKLKTANKIFASSTYYISEDKITEDILNTFYKYIESIHHEYPNNIILKLSKLNDFNLTDYDVEELFDTDFRETYLNLSQRMKIDNMLGSEVMKQLNIQSTFGEDVWSEIIDEKGCSYDGISDFIQAGILGFCCCGNPNETINMVGLFMEKFYYSKYKNGELEANYIKFESFINSDVKLNTFLLYYVDSLGFTEHGGSVYGSWISNKGFAFMKLYRLYKDEYKEINE